MLKIQIEKRGSIYRFHSPFGSTSAMMLSEMLFNTLKIRNALQLAVVQCMQCKDHVFVLLISV